MKVYDVLVVNEFIVGFKIIQIFAMSEVDARNIAEIKGYFVKDIAPAIEY